MTINTNKIDIYTLKAIEKQTKEHVLLDSLGGHMTVHGLIDVDTNSTFGRTIDAALENFVRPIRILLDTPSASGSRPPKLKNVEGDDGNFYNLLPAAQPELAKPKLQFKKLGDGQVRIEGKARNRLELKHFVQRKLAEEGISADDVLLTAQEQSEPSPGIKIRQELDKSGRRCIAKMATNLFAKDNASVFLTENFNGLRQYVLSDIARGSTEPVGLVYPPIEVRWSKAGFSTLDHVIGYEVSGGVVIGLVILFGHYQFHVDIGSTNEDLVKARSTYRVNPFLGLERVDEDFSLLNNFAARRREIPEFFRDCYITATNALLQFAAGETLNEFTAHVVTAVWKKGRPVTSDPIAIIAQTIAEYCYVHGMQRP